MPTPWKSGEIKNLDWGGCNSAAAGLIIGEKGKVYVKIKYYSAVSDSSYEKEVSGEIYSTVT